MNTSYHRAAATMRFPGILCALPLVASLLTQGCVDLSAYPPPNRSYLHPVCDADGCVSRLYFDPDASGENTGGSWSDAYSSLDQGLSSIVERLSFSDLPSEPSTLELWLTGGDHGTISASLVFPLSGHHSLIVRGGFEGHESDLSERDPQGPLTTIRRDVCDPAFSGSPSGVTTVFDRIEAIADDPCAAFVHLESSAAVTIENSRFEGFSVAFELGGDVTVVQSVFTGNGTGLSAQSASSLVELRNVAMLDNDIGVTVEGSLSIEDASFSKHDTAVSAGGALSVSHATITHGEDGIVAFAETTLEHVTITQVQTGVMAAGPLQVNDSTFADNSMGIFSTDSLLVGDSVFDSNVNGIGRASTTGSATVVGSSFSDNTFGIYNLDDSPEVIDLQVWDTSFASNFSGVVSEKGTVGIGRSVFTTNTNSAIRGAGTLVVLDSEFLDNEGMTGGAVSWNAAQGAVRLFSCLFMGNQAQNYDDGRGGAVEVAFGHTALVNSFFYENAAVDDSGRGGAISALGSTLEVYNTVFWKNEANQGSAIFVSDEASGAAGSLEVHFTTFAPAQSNQNKLAHSGPTLFANSIWLHNGLTAVCGGCPPPPDPPPAGTTDENGYCMDLARLSPCPSELGPCNQLVSCAGKGVPEVMPPDYFDLDSDGDTTEPWPIDILGNPRLQGDLDPGAYEL